LIGRHCQIADGVKIADSCIDNYTRIGRNTTIERSAVMDRAIIGGNAEIRDSIIGRHSDIRSNTSDSTRILQTSVISDDVTIDAGCRFFATKVYPHMHVYKQDLFNRIIS
jgi:NDP-sugar pyrophosphorylase family protein